jgi:hypothetical protein
MGADGRWRNRLPVARGIVDLIAGEIQSYRRQQHGGGTGSMPVRILLATLGLLALVATASAEGPWLLAEIGKPGAPTPIDGHATLTECLREQKSREETQTQALRRRRSTALGLLSRKFPDSLVGTH